MLGPFSKNETVISGGKQLERKTVSWYRTNPGQTRHPLPWNYASAKVQSLIGANFDLSTSTGWYYTNTSWGRSDTFGYSMATVNNKAFSKFVSAISSNAQLGVNLVEWQQTVDLLRGTLNALRRPMQTFANAARRYARSTSRGLASLQNALLKDMGGAWLAFHFGVEPLLGDLHSAIERLKEQSGKILNWQKVAVSARSDWKYTTTVYDGWSFRGSEYYRGIVKMGCEVRVKSSDVALYNDFGLLNPFTLAWELIPFSFVVDWFYPIGAFLSSLTDLRGYEFRDTYTTQYLRYSDEMLQGAGIYLNGVASSGARVERSLSVPAFRAPPFQLPSKLSITRAVTAIALLVGFLPKR